MRVLLASRQFNTKTNVDSAVFASGTENSRLQRSEYNIRSAGRMRAYIRMSCSSGSLRYESHRLDINSSLVVTRFDSVCTNTLVTG